MEAGRLRHWLLFEEKVVAIDTDGARSELWVQAFQVSPRMPCEVTDISGREFLSAEAVQSKVTTRIRCRYRAGIAPKMRCSDARTTWNIEAVTRDRDSGIEYLILHCSSGVNAGGTATP